MSRTPPIGTNRKRITILLKDGESRTAKEIRVALDMEQHIVNGNLIRMIQDGGVAMDKSGGYKPYTYRLIEQDARARPVVILDIRIDPHPLSQCWTRVVDRAEQHGA